MTDIAQTKVFVTTQALSDRGCGGIGQWFNLRHYADAKSFHVAVRQWCEDELPNEDGSQVIPYFSFDISFLEKADSECHFDVDTLLSDHEISPQVWVLIDMDTEDRDMLNAYALVAPKHENLFTSSKLAAEDMTVKLTNAKRQLFGKFDSYAAFGQALFEKNGFADGMPQELFSAINFDQVADVLGGDIVESEGYYFYTA